MDTRRPHSIIQVGELHPHLQCLLYCILRIFDEDEDGHIHAADMVEVLTNLGDRLTKSEARKLVANADVTGDGRIDYKGTAHRI